MQRNVLLWLIGTVLVIGISTLSSAATGTSGTTAGMKIVSGGDVGNILANIYNLASEQADTRSWLTLPNQLSIAQTAMTPGNHSLWVSGHGKIDFAVSKQGLTFVYLTFINNYFDSHVVQL